MPKITLCAFTSVLSFKINVTSENSCLLTSEAKARLKWMSLEMTEGSAGLGGIGGLLDPFAAGLTTAPIALSNTFLRPSWVKAELSSRVSAAEHYVNTCQNVLLEVAIGPNTLSHFHAFSHGDWCLTAFSQSFNRGLI